MTVPFTRLPSRWEPLKYHPTQHAYWTSPHRFNVVSAGRRCLEAGTLVATPKGPVPIEQLQAGDKVCGFDSLGAEPARVINVWNNGLQAVYPVYSGEEKILAATASHKLLARRSNGPWLRTPVVALTPTHTLRAASGTNCAGLKIGTAYLAQTYDITVANDTNLYVLHQGGIVTSNSGKTELAKRKLVRCALRGTRFNDPAFFAAAPTRDQAKGIYWKDLKQLVPRQFMACDPREGDLMIQLITGGELWVVGMDRPERIEGRPWDGGIMDEYGNMKKDALDANVMPALADRNGWLDLIGVPEGRNHYFDLWERAVADMAALGDKSQWGAYTWFSSDILGADVVAEYRRNLHPLMFAQEFEGSFVQWAGTAIFNGDNLLVPGVDGKLGPCPLPTHCDGVFVIIDTSIKSKTEHDSTAALFCAVSKHSGIPLTILDYDVVQIDGAMLVKWLPGIFERLEGFAKTCRARSGSLGAFVEDKVSGTILLQQAQEKGWPAKPVESKLTALGKDERALSISGHVYSGKIKVAEQAYNRVITLKGETRNHFWRQVTDYRIGDKDAAKRADDIFDTFCYAGIIALGTHEGY